MKNEPKWALRTSNRKRGTMKAARTRSPVGCNVCGQQGYGDDFRVVKNHPMVIITLGCNNLNTVTRLCIDCAAELRARLERALNSTRVR